MKFLMWTSSMLILVLSTIYYYPTFFYILLFLLYSLILIALAIYGTIYVHILMTTKKQVQSSYSDTNTLYNITKSSLFDERKTIDKINNLPLIFGRTVDGLLHQIIEYTLRDFIDPWLKNIVRKPKNLLDVLREDLWFGIEKLYERASKIDASKLIAVDIVVRTTVHLEKIRIAEARASDGITETVFSTSNYLNSEEKELEFLRKISEILVIFLLPRGYSLSPLKHFLSEILSYKIFYPTINMITNPDYINQKIVQFIETKLAVLEIRKRSYEYAASYEDFLRIINSTTNYDDLLKIRTSIVNDIMQATTMENIQRAKGLDPDCDDNNLTKSEMQAAIKLKRYLQQLSYAKIQCEKILTKLGWEGNFTNSINLSMLDILATVVGRKYLYKFLESFKATSLVGFYTSVEELKHASKASWHQLGAEIFYTYVRAPTLEPCVDKTMRKQMEAFLLGDIGPEIFYDAQKEVLKKLEEKYLQSFLLSNEYKKLKTILTTTDDIKDLSLINSLNQQLNQQTSKLGHTEQLNDNIIIDDLNIDEYTMDLPNHSTYARNKLEQLYERLNNKNQALDALKSSLKPESKILTILEKEVDYLRSEKRQLEAHLQRTEIWGDHLGKWQAIVQSVEVPDEKEPPQFMILVKVDENIEINIPESDKKEVEGISSGWVVLRSLTQFHELHKSLRPVCTEIRLLDLPTNTFKLFFLKNDKSSLEKAKGQIQKYLNFILEDDNLCQCEAVYSFLSPSSEHLKNVQPSPKKAKFSFSTLFKSQPDISRMDSYWGPIGTREPEDDISTYLEGNTLNNQLEINQQNLNSNCNSNNTHNNNNKQQVQDNDARDSIAEPLYSLLDEIFDMGGVFKWIRKSLISFVQITYGRTINKQIRESISYLFEEKMLHHYATATLKSFWPDGILSTNYSQRTNEMCEETLNKAKILLANNIPEILCNLVGAQTAKHGANKVFDAIQNPVYNKQLLYEMIEILMLELFPEIRQLNAANMKNN